MLNIKTWKQLKGVAKRSIYSLWHENLSGAEKMEQVVDVVYSYLEKIDDLVVILPGGFGAMAKLVVDSAQFDQWERALVKMAVEGVFTAVEEFMERLESGDLTEKEKALTLADFLNEHD